MTQRVCAEAGCETRLAYYNRSDKCSFHEGTSYQEAYALAAEGKGFLGPQTCRIVGITYRQLDYWTRTRLVTPSVLEARGSGSQRLYSLDDLLQLTLIKKLLDAGVSLQKTRQLMDYIRQLSVDWWGLTIVADASGAYVCRSDEEIINLLRSGQTLTVIATEKLRDQLMETVARWREKVA